MALKGKLDERIRSKNEKWKEQKIELSTVQLYGKSATPLDEVSIQVEGNKGIEMYVFAGPGPLQVM